MSRLAIDLDMSKCVSCGACAIACMDQNDIELDAGKGPFRCVFDMEEREGFSHLSLACMHCVDAPCIVGCPSACIHKDPETNLTVFDTTNCIGCHSCAMACPYGVLKSDRVEHKEIMKCNMCVHRTQDGSPKPMCVELCPMEAITLEEVKV